jgi:formate dehydrogenase subunit gamma
MATIRAGVRHVIVAIAMLGLAGLTSPVAAQQPASVNPTASSVKEDQLLRELHKVQGRGSIPDVKSYTVEQPAGRDWRHFHEVTLQWLGGIAILGMLALLAVFYLIRGAVRIAAGRSGRTVTRFSTLERFTHWLTASSFIILALSGLNVTFGKRLLLPLIGPDAFTSFSEAAKYAHNFLSFPFVAGLVLIIALWIRHNIPDKLDIEWLREGGGMVGSKHPPAGHFNAGQKIVFWVVVAAGAAMAVTGYLLMFPFSVTDIGGMQLIQIVHSVVAVLFVAVMLAHIYIGTPIGMEGAFEAMGTGEVDLNWAKQHHPLWLEEELAKGRTAVPPAQAAAKPAT